MNICVAGWHYWPEFYKIIKQKKHNVFVVAHRYNDILKDFDHILTTNIGLEFHCYNHFLMNVYEYGPTLYVHDDIIIEYDILDKIADIKHDQAYIFNDRKHEMTQGGKHGRMIFMSQRLQNFFRSYRFDKNENCFDRQDKHNPETTIKGTGPYRGFWYDRLNEGHVSGKPPTGIHHYNEAIYCFHRTLGRIRDKRYVNEHYDVVNRVYFPSVQGKRGKIK